MLVVEVCNSMEKSKESDKSPAKGTVEVMSTKELAKLMSICKYGPNYTPSKTGCELEIGKYYAVSRVEEKSTTWGARIGIIICIDEKEWCIYLGDIDKQKERFEALKKASKYPGKTLKIALESVEQRSNDKSVPHYDFKLFEGEEGLDENANIDVCNRKGGEGGEAGNGDDDVMLVDTK